MEGPEELGDGLRFHVEEGVDDVVDVRVVVDVFQADGCGDDWLGREVPVVMPLCWMA